MPDGISLVRGYDVLEAPIVALRCGRRTDVRWLAVELQCQNIDQPAGSTWCLAVLRNARGRGLDQPVSRRANRQALPQADAFEQMVVVNDSADDLASQLRAHRQPFIASAGGLERNSVGRADDRLTFTPAPHDELAAGPNSRRKLPGAVVYRGQGKPVVSSRVVCHA